MTTETDLEFAARRVQDLQRVLDEERRGNAEWRKRDGVIRAARAVVEASRDPRRSSQIGQDRQAGDRALDHAIYVLADALEAEPNDTAAEAAGGTG